MLIISIHLRIISLNQFFANKWVYVGLYDLQYLFLIPTDTKKTSPRVLGKLRRAIVFFLSGMITFWAAQCSWKLFKSLPKRRWLANDILWHFMTYAIWHKISSTIAIWVSKEPHRADKWIYDYKTSNFYQFWSIKSKKPNQFISLCIFEPIPL